MKKLVLLFIFLIQFFANLLAQEKAIIVVSVSGSVSYLSDVTTINQVTPGVVLTLDGKVTLANDAKAMIYYNAEFISLKSGVNILKDVCNVQEGRRNFNIDGKIGERLQDAIDLANLAGNRDANWTTINNFKKSGFGDKGAKDGFGDKGAKDGFGDKGAKDGFGDKGAKDGFGEKGAKDGFGDKGAKDGFGDKGAKAGFDDKGAKDGFGDKGAKDGFGDKGAKDGFGDKGAKDGWGGVGKHIHLILPAGKLELKSTQFSWSRPANTTSYQLVIKNSSGKNIYSIQVSDTFVDVDLKKIKLKYDEEYQWVVSSVQTPTIGSSTNSIVIEKMEPSNTPETKLSKSKIYNQADATTQLLMKAIILENDEWYYEAALIYMALKKKEPSNQLVKMMHAAFWYRGDIYEMADAAVMP